MEEACRSSRTAVKSTAWPPPQETAWRQRQRAAAVTAADNGALPALRATATAAVDVEKRWGCWDSAGLAPDAARLLRWKAGAVVALLERRVGEEAFIKVLLNFLRRAKTAAEAAAAAAKHHGEGGKHGGEASKNSGDNAPLGKADKASAGQSLGTEEFMVECRRVGGMDAGEAKAFLARWVDFAGTPFLRGGYHCYYDRAMAAYYVEMAVRLEGGQARTPRAYGTNPPCDLPHDLPCSPPCNGPLDALSAQQPPRPCANTLNP